MHLKSFHILLLLSIFVQLPFSTSLDIKFGLRKLSAQTAAADQTPSAIQLRVQKRQNFTGNNSKTTETVAPVKTAQSSNNVSLQSTVEQNTPGTSGATAPETNTQPTNPQPNPQPTTSQPNPQPSGPTTIERTMVVTSIQPKEVVRTETTQILQSTQIQVTITQPVPTTVVQQSTISTVIIQTLSTVLTSTAPAPDPPPAPQTTDKAPNTTPAVVIEAEPTKTSNSQPITTASAKLICADGYYLCPPEFRVRGDCCRLGFGCAVDRCIPPSTYSEDVICKTGSYLCPASLGSGCCPNDRDCGINNCPAKTTMQASTPATILGVTITTTDIQAVATSDGGVVTDITVVTKAAPETIDPGSKMPTIAPPSATETLELSPTAVGSGSARTLSGITIGGILAGTVIGVSAMILAGYFTYRRVKRRGNLDPFGFIHSKKKPSDSFLRGEGVITSNAFDPNAANPTRKTGSKGSRGIYGSVDQGMVGYFPKQPLSTPMVNTPGSPLGGFDFGLENPDGYLGGNESGSQTPSGSTPPRTGGTSTTAVNNSGIGMGAAAPYEADGSATNDHPKKERRWSEGIRSMISRSGGDNS